MCSCARNVINLCSLLIYTPSSHRHRPRRNRCVFSCKMRLAFISTVNLHVTLANPGEIVVFFNEKCALYQPPQIPCVFLGKMHLAFLVPVNSYDTRPTALGFRIFFHLKRASRKPFQIPCVFSSKTRLALNVILLNLYDSRPTAPAFLVFFKENARCRNPASFLRFTFIVFSQVQCVLGSQVSVNSHVMLPAPAGSCFFSQGKTRLGGITRKLGRKTYDQGVFSCVCRKEKK